MYKINEVSILKDYNLKITYSDKTEGIVDLSDMVGKGVFTLYNLSVLLGPLG